VAAESISIADAQNQVDQWIKSIGVRYFSELTNLAQLVEEVGELARLISRTYGEQSFKDPENQPELADEMADVLFVLICLANQTGVDLTEAFQKNLMKKTVRDKDRHHNNPKLKEDLGPIVSWDPCFFIVRLQAAAAVSELAVWWTIFPGFVSRYLSLI